MEMIVCSAELRLQIEESLIGSAQIPQSPKNECEWTISKLSVSSSGSIELFNQKYGIHIEFQPIVNDSEVQWVCKGKPEKYVPVNCRENT